MPILTKQIVQSLLQGFSEAKLTERPYHFWMMTNCLPPQVVEEVLALPFAAADIEGVSGKRELHNNSRRYFDVEGREQFACMEAISSAFQDTRVTAAIEQVFRAELNRTYLRIEFAQDVDGFWLEPHTDIGVKMFTFLLYLSKDHSHADLGTDVYDNEKKWVGRTPYQSNSGMIFVPSNITYHGFEKRPIAGVRKLLVINYVTEEWRAREQLAYPDELIRMSAEIGAKR
jgi:hypothetical protein